MKYKLLCDRCYADPKAFTIYKNGYNTGKCRKCNGHGFILTKDKLKADESHIHYFDTIQRKFKVVQEATINNIKAIRELELYQHSHEQLHPEEFGKLNEYLNRLKNVKDTDSFPQEKDSLTKDYKKILEAIKSTETEEYKKQLYILEELVKETTHKKEKAIKEYNSVNQFYNSLLESEG